MLKEAVEAQVALLIDGKPLEVFDAYFGSRVQMFANGVLFAAGAEEGRRKQEPFISAAVAIDGAVTDIKVVEDVNLCVFRNRSRFTTADGAATLCKNWSPMGCWRTRRGCFSSRRRRVPEHRGWWR